MARFLCFLRVTKSSPDSETGVTGFTVAGGFLLEEDAKGIFLAPFPVPGLGLLIQVPG